MSTNQLNCASCGAVITVPENREFINCPYCAAILAVIRGEGYTAFKVVESITKSLPTLDDFTQKTGQLPNNARSEPVPVSEDQRLRDQIQIAEMQLANLQADINAIERVQRVSRRNPSLRRLYSQVFQTLETLRTLYQTLAALGPQDIDSCIAALESEIPWINAELQALESASDGESQDASSVWETTSDQIRDYRRKLLIKISDLHIQKIKEPLPSFQVKEVSLHDRAAISAVLAIIRADQDRVAKMPQTLEVSMIKDELTARYQTLLKAQAELKRSSEQARLQPLLIPVSSGNNADSEKTQPTGLRALFRRKK